MLFWFPKIADDFPVPRTEILPLTSASQYELRRMLDGEPLSPTRTELIKATAREIGYPLFLRSDQGSAKHQWRDTCYVPTEEDLIPHLVRLVEWHECIGFMGLMYDALVFREYVDLVGPFTAFNGMPVARERRLFVQDGGVLCDHAYWVSHALDRGHHVAPLPADWRGTLRALNTLHPDDKDHLYRMGAEFSRRVPGYWSVDFAYTAAGDWILIDAARGELSWHPRGCPHRQEVSA